MSCFGQEIIFLCKFGPANQNYLFKNEIWLLLVIWTCWIRLCTFFWPKILFLGKFGPEKLDFLKWSLLPRLIWICWIRLWCLCFLFWTGNTAFRANLVQKTELLKWDEALCLDQFGYAEFDDSIDLFWFVWSGNILFRPSWGNMVCDFCKMKRE